LPFDSTLLFVLDDPISSKSSKPGENVRAHLKSAIVVNGRTVAPAGAPGQIRVVAVSGSDIEDKYGFVDIFFEPLALPDGRVLPLRASVARLEPRDSSGHESTVEAEDTVGDIFVPYYTLWQIFRHRFRTSGANRSDDHPPSQWNDRNRHAAPIAAEFRGSRRHLSAVAASDTAPDGRPPSEGQVHTVTFALPNRDLDANALGRTMFLAVLREKRAEKGRFCSC
jgi:hypothetical protein